MEDLRNTFVEISFTDVKTLLNSGNVIFTASETDPLQVTTMITKGLQKRFGFSIDILVRTSESLQQIVAANPFAKVEITQATKLYVTFLSEQPKSTLPIPYESEDKEFKILEVSNDAIFSVLTLTEKTNTLKAMGIIEKEFGKNVTTRNWNTVKKCADLSK